MPKYDFPLTNPTLRAAQKNAQDRAARPDEEELRRRLRASEAGLRSAPPPQFTQEEEFEFFEATPGQGGSVRESGLARIEARREEQRLGGEFEPFNEASARVAEARRQEALQVNPPPDFSNIPPGGHQTNEPAFGIIPSGSGLEDFAETVNLPFTAFGGSLIDAFHTLTGKEEVEGSRNPFEAIRASIERQQERPLAARLLSESLTPFEAVGVAVGVSRAGALLGAKTARAAGLAGLPPISRAQQLKQLEEFGLVLDASVNDFAAPLRELDTVIGEVVTREGPGGKALGVLVGPSVSRTSDVGKIVTAAQRQRIAMDELVNTAMAGAFDSHLGQFTSPLPIDPKTGFWKGADVPWQKVFEAPDKFAKHMTPEARALINDVNQMTNDEAIRLLEDVGITPNVRARPSNEYYVPRNVEEIRGIETRRGADPDLQRHYEDITEGLDAGVVYGKNPRQDIELYMRWVYRQVAKKQLDDALEDFGVTAKELVKEPVRTRYVTAQTARRALETMRRRIRRVIGTSEAQGRTALVRSGERTRQLGDLQSEVARLDDIITDLPDIPLIGAEPTRLELQNARSGTRAATAITRRADRELLEASQRLARISGKGQGTVEELRRLDAQFERLAGLRDELALDPIKRLLEGQAPARGGRASIAQPARRGGQFRAVSAEETLAGRRLESTQQRFVNLEDAKVQIQRQVDQLKDDVVVARELTKEANDRLIKATTEAGQRERQRGIVRGGTTQAQRQRRRLEARTVTQGRRAGTAANVRLDIQTRVDFLKAQITNIDDQLKVARTEHVSAKNAYSNAIDEAKRSEIAPGALWGPNQPNEISVKQWHNRFFPLEDAKLLEAALGQAAEPSGFTKGFQTLANSRRFLSAVGDFAMPMIQGLPVLATNPNAWARSTFRHYQAFFDPAVQSRLIRDNIVDYQWLAKNGVPIGDPEFFAALQPGQGLSADRLFKLLPNGEEAQRVARLAGRQTFGRFQASYNAGLGWARVQLLKAIQPTWKGTDAELARYIRNLTGGLDPRALGVGPARRAAEGMWLAFSPRLLRSTIALSADALRPTTVVGQRSLRTLATLVTGATTTYVLTGMALGKDWNEIKAGLNPLNGKRFLSHQVNGDWIGVGGQIRAISQLIAAIVVAPFKGELGNLISLNRRDNPILSFFGSRGAPGAEIAAQAGEGLINATGGEVNFDPFEQIDGPVDFLKHLGQGSLPFTLQGIMEGEQALTSTMALQGLRTSPETPFDRLNAARAGAAIQLEFNEAYNDLDQIQKRKVNDSVPQDVKDDASKARTEMGSKTEVLKLALAEVDTNIDRQIEAVAAAGPGKEFREKLADFNRSRADRKDQERQGDQHAEARQFFEELEPSELVRDRALDAYFAAVTDERLESPSGDYNFVLREELLGAVKEEFGDKVFGEVETFVHENEHPLAKELREDRETLKPYWEIRDFVADSLGEPAGDIYRAYLNSSPTDQTLGRLIFKDIINGAERQVAALQQLVKSAQPAINDALVKWEYSVSIESLLLQGAGAP